MTDVFEGLWLSKSRFSSLSLGTCTILEKRNKRVSPGTNVGMSVSIIEMRNHPRDTMKVFEINKSDYNLKDQQTLANQGYKSSLYPKDTNHPLRTTQKKQETKHTEGHLLVDEVD